MISTNFPCGHHQNITYEVVIFMVILISGALVVGRGGGTARPAARAGGSALLKRPPAPFPRRQCLSSAPLVELVLFQRGEQPADLSKRASLLLRKRGPPPWFFCS